MDSYKRIIEKKEGGKYIFSGTVNTDKVMVLASLADDMRMKFLHRSTSYTRVEFRTNYDGTETVKFYHGNGYRTTYIIPSGSLLF